MRKKLLAVLLAVVMIIGLVPVSVLATDDISVLSVKPDKTSATAGETITFSVTASAVSAWIGWQYYISIPAGLTYVEGSGAMDSGFVSIVKKTGDDVAEFIEDDMMVLALNGMDVFALESDTTMVTFQCTVDADAALGEYKITLGDLVGFTGEGDELSGEDYIPSVTAVTVTKAPCKHETTKAVEAQAPTCTDDGVKAHFVCQNEECGALLDAEGNVLTADAIVDPALGHKMEKTEAKAPTCTEPGNNAYFTCETCGKVFRDEAGDTATTVEEETIAVDPTAHKLTSVEAQDATCTADGWTAYKKCDFCGKLFNASGEEITEEDVVIPAAHTYGELVPAAEAVHSQTELKPAVDAHYICSECGKYFTEAKAETTLKELTGETPKHTYGDWQTTAENHWKECSCGLKAEEGAHVYDNDEDMKCNTCDYDRSCKHDGETTTVAAKASTCKTQGNAEYVTCNACGAVIEGSADKLPLDPANHEVELAHTAAKEPDCENAGNVEYWSCSACEKNFSDAEGTVVIDKTAVDALGHDWSDWTDNGDAKCGQPGTQTRTCKREGCTASENKATDALEHAWGEWEVTTAPTCTEKGVETRTCTREGCTATETRAVAALGHDFGEAVETKAPTCTEAGEKTGYCSRCDETTTEEIAALGHEFVEYKETTAPTCTADGEEIAKCTRCDATDTKVLAKLGHDFGEAVETKAPTCTEAGEKTGECSRCDATTTETIPALGHDLGEWYQTKEPTEDEEGEERRDCSRCDYFETNVLDALGTPFMDEWYWTMMMVHNQKFEIEADADGGEISPAGVSKVKFGTSITYTITPDEGYEIETVFVDGKDIGAVSEYTFKRVTKDHTIYAVCSEIEEEPVIADSIYADVSADDWFYDAVAFVTEEGLMNGTGDKLFSPDNATTRAMIVTILWRLEGEPEAAPSAFTDVADDMWYTAAIDWAAENGIVNGYEDGTFGPARNITREQVMAIFHRYAAYKGIADDLAVSMLPQYDCSVWAENDVNWADMNGLLDNIGVDIFDMTAEASRAEIAAYLADFCVNVIQ